MPFSNIREIDCRKRKGRFSLTDDWYPSITTSLLEGDVVSAPRHQRLVQDVDDYFGVLFAVAGAVQGVIEFQQQLLVVEQRTEHSVFIHRLEKYYFRRRLGKRTCEN